jgi:hypothetical protein
MIVHGANEQSLIISGCERPGLGRQHTSYDSVCSCSYIRIGKRRVVLLRAVLTLDETNMPDM